MNRTIVFNWKKGDRSLESSASDREYYYAADRKDAYLNHIESTGVDSYILNCRDRNVAEIKEMIRHIHYLNAIITIILFDGDYGIFEPLVRGSNIHLAKDRREIGEHLKSIDRTGRTSNRIQWPLKAEFWKKSEKGDTREKALVTSISSGGCFLKTEKLSGLEKGSRLTILFHFRNFDFLSEGLIVRLPRDGMAMEFRDVSPQTGKYIQEIINEKILSEIMQMIE